MTIDLQLEHALRRTFTAYADTVTAGPAWEAASEDLAGSPLWDDGADLPFDDAPPASPTAPPPPRPVRPRRWLVPVVAAAAVAAVALTTAVLTWSNSHPGIDHTAAATQGPAAPAESVTVGSDGSITVAVGTPSLVLDLYMDALCPICSDFEQQYGTAVSRAVDDGQFAVRYRMVDFLNAGSASGDYSTRAYAALLTVAREDDPTVFRQFYAALFDPATQPAENGSSDLTDDDLAALAGRLGAAAATQQAVAGGAGVAEARTLAKATLAALRDLAATEGRAPGTPTVAANGHMVSTNSPTWLGTLLDQPAPSSSN